MIKRLDYMQWWDFAPKKNLRRNRTPSKRLPAPALFLRLQLYQVEALYELYKLDFEMFGYSATAYLEAARKKKMEQRKLQTKQDS